MQNLTYSGVDEAEGSRISGGIIWRIKSHFVHLLLGPSPAWTNCTSSSRAFGVVVRTNVFKLDTQEHAREQVTQTKCLPPACESTSISTMRKEIQWLFF